MSDQQVIEMAEEIRKLRKENTRLKQANFERQRQYAKEAYDEVAEGEIKALGKENKRARELLEEWWCADDACSIPLSETRVFLDGEK